ncbi:MAG TPA: hypothetical protein VF017_11120 [Thermoanaerobaculia bacterium]|nr:hypothetical protein [Thermoanaerobaculia bacterium]
MLKSLLVSGLLASNLLAAPTTLEAAGSPVAYGLAAEAGCSGCIVSGLERRVLSGDVSEHSFLLRVGPGEHDLVRLHRVVREQAPFVPVPTSRAVFMAHGDIWAFDAAFLSGPGGGLPVFLAARGIDVWGIDFRWTQVPADTADLSFLAQWGIETDARDLRLAMAVARLARALTGGGAGGLPLLGWSRGGQIGYAALDAEAQVPPRRRQIEAFIPVDIYLKSDVPELQQAACARYADTSSRIANGELADTGGQVLAALGVLATSAPQDPSPILPGFTNLQAGLLVGEATFALFPLGLEFVPFYHFTGGTFDADGLPSGLSYSDLGRFLDFLATGAPWQPLRELADGDAVICDDPAVADVPWDDHLSEVTVPVLYLGAGGGFGEYGIYTTTLLGSQDVSHLVVTLTPPEARLFDLGHADIFQAEAAPTLFWQPILEWLLAH